MTADCLRRRTYQAKALLASLSVAFALLFLGGCGGCTSRPDYPPNLKFSPRSDRIVLKLPEKPATAINDPGKRDEEIALLDSLGGKTLELATIPASGRDTLQAFLQQTFGTPGVPTLNVPTEASIAEVASRLKLTNAHLAEGGKLFRRHCLQCHNLSGDGRGTAGVTFPFPRDYRQGVFKFVTSGDNARPRRADLVQVIKDGLKGTPMPSFGLLQDGERDLLAGYVSFLAIRGEVEFEALKALAEGNPRDNVASLKAILQVWENADNAPAIPQAPDDGEPGSPAHQESVRRGYKLFTAKADNSCISCHAEFGRKPVLRYDVWGTVAQPANFTENSLKAGMKAEDVFARIRGGIPVVGMPAHPVSKYSDRDVWDLVRFVRSAPYMRELPPDVLKAVYPPANP